MNTNEPVLQSKLSDMTTVEGVASTIDRGYRAVSVQITDVSGVAGLIQPGSHVDVLFTRPGSMAEATTSTILQNVKVLSTGRTRRDRPDGGSARAEIARGHPGADCRRTRRSWNWPRTRARSASRCAIRWIRPDRQHRSRSPRKCSTR